MSRFLPVVPNGDPGVTSWDPKSRLFVQVAISVAAAVLSIKLGKIVLNFGSVGSMFDVLERGLRMLPGLALSRILAIFVAAYLFGKVFIPRWRWLAVPLPILAFAALKLVQAILFGHPLLDSWLIEASISESRTLTATLLDDEALLSALLWRDIAFLSGFTLLVYVLILVTSVKHLKPLTVCLVGVVALMFALEGLELASYLKTGVSGSGTLLAYFFSGFGGDSQYWRVLLRGAMDGETLFAFVIPFVVGGVAALSARRLLRTMPRLMHPRRSILVPAALGLALVTVASRPALSDIRYARQLENTLSRFA